MKPQVGSGQASWKALSELHSGEKCDFSARLNAQSLNSDAKKAGGLWLPNTLLYAHARVVSHMGMYVTVSW